MDKMLSYGKPPSKGEYRVIYVIDISADSPKEAALLAEKYIKNPHDRPAFDTISSKGKIAYIDLSQE